MKIISEEYVIVRIPLFEAARLYKEITSLTIHPTKWGKFPLLGELYGGLYVPTRDVLDLIDEEDD